MARGTRIVRGRSGGIHNKEWTAICTLPGEIDLAPGALLAFEVFVADEAETLLRTRGRIRATLDAAAIDESFVLAVGLAVVSSKSATIGVTAIPAPVTDGSYPWLWHGFLLGNSFSGVNSTATTDILEVDSKAMRKVKEDESVVLAFEMCASDNSGGVVNILAGLRSLTGD